MDKVLNRTLYKHLCEEQKLYHSWLCLQSPEEVLKHAEEYLIREHILKVLEMRDLTDKQANALLDLREPLDYLYQEIKREEVEDFWAVYLEAVMDSADRLARKTGRDKERG